MRFSPALLDEIRARLPVSEVVSRHVRLKRSGREYTGLSPFKQEKTPSFTVNDEKGFYHCFATGEHGDIFTFLIKVEGISFPESVEKLAAEAGVELPKASPEMQQREQQSLRLREVTEASCRFFEQALGQSHGRNAAGYLHKRGLDQAVQKRFRLGYAPGTRDSLKSHLLGLGFSLEEIVTSGMCIGGRDIAVPYDRFRDRVMFPICDLKGQVIAFGGRALSEQQKAKYLNSPETPLFHKGRLLYNVASARQSAYEREMVIAVEGYMDVIACARAGFDNVVAPLGTALTEDQLRLMWRLSPEPVLCFDGDAAGKKAAGRALDTALPLLAPGVSLRFAFLPDNQDPDDLIASEGAAAFGAIINKAAPLVDVLWRRELEAAPTDTPERRAAYEARLYDLIGRIDNSAVKSHYEKEARSRLWNLWKGVGRTGGVGHAGRTGNAGHTGSASRTSSSNSWQGGRSRSGGAYGGGSRGFSTRFQGGGWRDEPQPASDNLRQSAMLKGPGGGVAQRETLVLEALITHPWLLDDYSEEVAELPFAQKQLSALREAILLAHINCNHEKGLDREELRVHLKENGFGDTLESVDVAHIGVDQWVREKTRSRRLVEESWRQMIFIYRRQVALRQQLDGAERAFQEEGSEENFVKVRDLNAQLLDSENMYAGAADVGSSDDVGDFFATMLAQRDLK